MDLNQHRNWLIMTARRLGPAGAQYALEEAQKSGLNWPKEILDILIERSCIPEEKATHKKP